MVTPFWIRGAAYPLPVLAGWDAVEVTDHDRTGPLTLAR